MNISTSDILTGGKQVSSIKSPKKKNIFSRDINISITRNTDQLKHRFFSETSVLISADLNLKRTLEIVMNSTSKAKDIEIIRAIHEGIMKGDSFSEAIRLSEAFDRYDYYLVKVGEEAGTLSEVLRELAVFYEKKISQKRQIRSALTYPALVLITTFFSITFMLNYIVPMFRDIFLRMRGSLPPLTKFVVNLSEKFPSYLMFIIILSVILNVIIITNRNTEWYRKYSSSLILRIPILRDVVKLTYSSRFCQTMKLLISSRVHLLDATELVRQMIGFYPMESALTNIKLSLTQGKTLSESMEQFSIFDKKMIALTRVAEEVNRLDMIFDQLHKQYAAELDTKVKTMNNLLEPVLIIFVGALVAFILVSMYLPIFQIGTSIS